MNHNKLLPVEHHPGFVKDMTSGAILNTDSSRLSAYKRQKKLMRSAIVNQERIDTLESEMKDIKGLLNQILGKL